MKTLITASIVLVLLAGHGRGAIAEKVRAEIRPLAKQLIEVVKQEKQPSIAIGAFTGPAQLNTNFGPGISTALTLELETLQSGVVNPDSVLSVTGTYAYVRNKDLNEIRLTVVVQKSDGEEVGQLAVDLNRSKVPIRDSELVSTMTGRTIELPPTHTRQQLNERIKDNVEKPNFHCDGTRIQVKEGSKFALEVLVTTKEQAPTNAAGWAKVPARAPTRTNKGEPFVDLKQGEVYALRVHNQSEHQAGIAILIDGVDVFTFSGVRTPPESRFPAGKARYSHYVIGKSALITGWHLSNEKVSSFLVTGYGEGAASKLRNLSAGNTGVITVCFALAWEGDEPPPEERGGRGGNETGFGPPASVALKEVKRKIGVVREVISVRYSK